MSKQDFELVRNKIWYGLQAVTLLGVAALLIHGLGIVMEQWGVSIVIRVAYYGLEVFVALAEILAVSRWVYVGTIELWDQLGADYE